MLRKTLNKLTASVLTLVMTATLITPSMAFANEVTSSVETSNSTETVLLKEAKERVSIHDPSIIKLDGMYYVFGSHIDAAKSTDLKNWTRFTNGYTTPSNTLFGDLSTNLAGSFDWAGENDSDSKGGFSIWAPDVFWNKDYINGDGTTGAYLMYYSASSTYIRSAIGYAASTSIEGPYTYVDTIIYSGFTRDDAMDANSVTNKKYTNTNIQDLIEGGTITGPRAEWFNVDGSYNNSTFTNAIDATIFYDETGKLWMTYGSWSGGIFILEIDKATGKAIYPGTDGVTMDGRLIDRYFGTKISGGFTQSGEGPYVVYDKTSGYYYLYVTYAGLGATGGYNMRMFRSDNPDGPYVDASKKSAVLPNGSTANTEYGIKLMGNYKFSNLAEGYRAPGHNSSFIDSDGQMYLIYHTRFDGGTEYHEVRVHQMFRNEDGWPVVAPYEYNSDIISETGYSKDEVVGTYEFINHGNSNNGASMLPTLSVNLNADLSVSGGAIGTWSMTDGSYYMNIVIDGVTYKGVFFKQNDESIFESKVMTFSAVGSNNESIWGSKTIDEDTQAVEYDSYYLDTNVEIPAIVKSDITLPTTGANQTTITWSSSNKYLLSSEGIVNRLDRDVEVTLTARITKGNASASKTFKVTILAESPAFSGVPTYQYDFSTVVDAVYMENSGSKLGNAELVGSASVVEDEQRGHVLQISNTADAKKVNYLALPSDTFDGITTDGFTVSMWVNVDQSNPAYFEHSALFEANGGGQNQYPLTRMGANLITRINSNGAWSDAFPTTGLTSNTWSHLTYTIDSAGITVYLNGVEIGKDEENIALCFSDNFLANMDDVRVGSGNIWGDRDIASAKFDNVAIFNTTLSEADVEALYKKENPDLVKDKSKLLTALISASEYLAANATEEDKLTFQAAITVAEAVLANATTTSQVDIDAAAATLIEATQDFKKVIIPTPAEPGTPGTPATPGTPGTPGTSASPATPAVSALVNGKAVNLGTTTTSKRDGQTMQIISIDPQKMEDLLTTLAQGTVINILGNSKFDVVVVEFSGQTINSMGQKQAVVAITKENATYTLPMQFININDLSKQFGNAVALKDMKIQIEMGTPTNETVRIVEESSIKGKFNIVVPPLNFSVKAIYVNKTIEVSKFNSYVERTIEIPEGIEPSRITTGVIVETDGTVHHVPTKIIKVDGKYYGVINSLSNSTYILVEHQVEFNDVANHWAKDAVNDMGSRMVVHGVDDNTFNPDKDITRAEFAAIITRGLGLNIEKGEMPFSDVLALDWYSNATKTAYNYNLISGFEDGAFRPMDKITREQAMSIIAKAMKITELSEKLKSEVAVNSVNSFVDANAVSEWALNGINDCLQAGIVSGRSTELAPKANITRAEVAVIVQRLLLNSSFIN
jgi:arabinan endo-1,5-alpha-L-arabinosidase